MEYIKMLTAEQIRAARALLNWTQADLAREARISLPSINSIERGVSSPRIDTLRTIKSALENGGIEFLGQQGVRLHSELFQIQEYQGDDFIEKQNDDLFSCMHGPDDVAMMCGLDEKKFPLYAPDQVLRYDDYQQKTKFTQKILVAKGDTFMLTNLDAYRWISPELLGTIPYLVYKDRFVMIMWESKRVVIIRSQSIADTFRKQFEFLWEMATPVNGSSENKLSDPRYRETVRKSKRRK
jgi:transcriptional regulator with XRE-family HTH domain